MTYSLASLPQVLRDAGLRVVEHPGWEMRGHGDMGKVQGVLCHHTGGPLTGELPDINVLVQGRPDLPGPLSQLALGRSGTFYVLAAGKGYHAGAGSWQGVTDGNSHFIGIEAENTVETTGPRADPWPEVQLDAYARGCAAIHLPQCFALREARARWFASTIRSMGEVDCSVAARRRGLCSARRPSARFCARRS